MNKALIIKDSILAVLAVMISDKEYPPDGRYGKATVNGVAAFKSKFWPAWRRPDI